MRIASILTAGLALLLCACDDKKPAANTPAKSGPLTVMTSFYPTTYFAKRIAGEHAKVVCPLPKDADAAFWQPSAEVLAQYQQADLIVLNGANFEHWTATATLPESRVVMTADAFKKDWIVIKNATTHSHGPAGSHTHAGVNGHTWPDPVNAIAQADAIRDALIAKDPAHKSDYIANAQKLDNELADLAARFKSLALTKPMFASHPSYSYLARRCGWKLIEFTLESDEPPTEKQIADLRQAKADNPDVEIMLWEDKPGAPAQKLMDELKLKVVIFDPAENAEATDDYLAIMRKNLENLK
jgi:zinc transport system substrate-binding protein